jgi:hypothetical protein
VTVGILNVGVLFKEESLSSVSVSRAIFMKSVRIGYMAVGTQKKNGVIYPGGGFEKIRFNYAWLLSGL